MLDGLRGEESIAELCRREGIAQSIYYKWSKEFLEAGKRRLAGDTARAASTGEGQTATFIEEVKNYALHIPVLLAVTTGMRRGEVLALRWCDVDLNRATISVTQTLEKTSEGGLCFKQPKTKKSVAAYHYPQ